MSMRIKAVISSVVEMDVDTNDLDEACNKVKVAIQNDYADYLCKSVDVEDIECIATDPDEPYIDVFDALRDDAMDAAHGWEAEIV